jgi:hypothetical protein
VHRLAYSSGVVAFKMGRRAGLGLTARAGLAVGGAYLKRYVTDPAAAGQPPAHFQRNPLTWPGL